MFCGESLSDNRQAVYLTYDNYLYILRNSNQTKTR